MRVRLPAPRSGHGVSRVAWWEGPLVHLTLTKHAKTSHQRLAIYTTLSAICSCKKLHKQIEDKGLIGLKQYCILALSKMPRYTAIITVSMLTKNCMRSCLIASKTCSSGGVADLKNVKKMLYTFSFNLSCAGAVRVELCSNLMEGGTTPSLGR